MLIRLKIIQCQSVFRLALIVGLILISMCIVPNAQCEKVSNFIVSLKNKSMVYDVFKHVREWKQIGNSNLFKVKISDQNIIDMLKHDPRVKFVEKVSHGHFDDVFSGTLDETDWFNEIDGSKIQALSLHKKVIVALIDSGIDLSNSFYSSHLFVNTREIPGDGIDNDHNGFIDDVHGWDFGSNDNDPQDILGHGSMTGSLILTVCPNAIILPLKINNSGEDSFGVDSLVEAIYYAIQMGANIINLSLSMSEPSPAVEEAIEDAYNHGIVIIASAGNDPSYIAFPASMNDTIAVGSVYNGSPAWFSPSGTSLDLVAPGVDIACIGLGGTEMLASGTSLSAAIISGVCADILSMNPYLTPNHIRELLMRGCRDLGETGKDIYFGAGEIDGTILSKVAKPAIILPEHPFYAFYANLPLTVQFYLPPTDVTTYVYIALEYPDHEVCYLNAIGLWEKKSIYIVRFSITDFLNGILFGDNGIFPVFTPANLPQGLYRWWIGILDSEGNFLSPPTYSYMLIFK